MLALFHAPTRCCWRRAALGLVVLVAWGGLLTAQRLAAVDPAVDPGALDLTPPATVPVDVWLTDANGPGVGPGVDWSTEDLTVFLDDEPVSIVANSLVPAASLPGRFLVFVDDVFCMPAPRNRFIDRLREQLDDLGPEDLMAVVAYDGRRLAVLAPWTRSVPRLMAGLQRARDRPALGPRRLAEERQLMATHRAALRPGRTASFSGTGFRGALANPALGAAGLRHARTVTEQVADVMLAAAAAVDRLGAESASRFGDQHPVSARGTLLLLAGAWPVSSSALILTGQRGDGPVVGAAAGQHVLAPLVAAADRWGFAVSPVTVPVWGTGGRVEKRQRRGATNVLMAATLDELAIATGGTSWLDGAQADLLRRSLSASHTGYRFTILRRWRGDDRRASLRVAVAGIPHVTRTRTGLADPSSRSRVARAAAAAVMVDQPLPGAGQLEIEVEPGGRGAFRITATALAGTSLPASGLTWAVVDPAVPTGGSVSIGTESPVAVPASDRSGWSYVLDVRGRPRGERLVLAAFDPKTDRMWLKDVLLPTR